MASSGDLLLNETQKKLFVSLKDEVTIIHQSLTTASLAEVDEALNGPIRICFVVTRARYEVDQSFFFVFVLFLYFPQKPGYLFKKELHIERKSTDRFIFLCD